MMKTKIKQLATAVSLFWLAGSVQARPFMLPTATTGQAGTFAVTAENQITLTGNPVSLTTSLPSSGDIVSGAARFMGGGLQYYDGSAVVDCRMARVTFGSQIKNGQVIYVIKGLVYGTLTQGGSVVDVNGNFAVNTLPAPPDTPLEQAQIDASHLLLTLRSNINNSLSQ